MLPGKGIYQSSVRSAGRFDRSASPQPTPSNVSMKLDEMRARLQIKQIRPKTALDETRRAEIADKARVIQEKITKSYARDEEFFTALDERIVKLRTVIEKAQSAKDAMASTHPKDLKDIGASFGKEIAAETNQHLSELHATQSELIQKSHALQSEVVHSVSVASAAFRKKEQSLIADTETVASAFQQQRRERELFFESLIGKLGGAMLNLHEKLVAERSDREQTHRQRLQDIAEMRHRFTKAIDVCSKPDSRKKMQREGAIGKSLYTC